MKYLKLFEKKKQIDDLMWLMTELREISQELKDKNFNISVNFCDFGYKIYYKIDKYNLTYFKIDDIKDFLLTVESYTKDILKLNINLISTSDYTCRCTKIKSLPTNEEYKEIIIYFVAA